jgi:hypothetical protein
MLDAKRAGKSAWLIALAMCVVCTVLPRLVAGGILAAAGVVMTQGGPWRSVGAGVAGTMLVALAVPAMRKVRSGASC